MSPRGELRFAIQDEGTGSADFLAFCQKLIDDIGRPVVLILDTDPVHEAKAVKAYAEQSQGQLTLRFLPPRCPEHDLEA